MSTNTPETPIPRGMGTADPAGHTYPTMEDKYKGISMSIDIGRGDDQTTYYDAPNCTNSAPVKPYIPPDRGYYARTYGRKRRAGEQSKSSRLAS